MIKNPDILIAGGGAAGIAAAIGAARAGAKVTLLERNSFAGGKATAAEVGTICGLYHFSRNGDTRYSVEGFAREFAESLAKRSNTVSLSNAAGLHFLPYRPADFRILTDELLRLHKVEIVYHATVCDVQQEDNRITAVEAIVSDRRQLFSPRAVIDCTGESIISALVGAELMESDEYQAAAQVWTMENVESETEALLGMQLIRSIAEGIAKGALEKNDDRVTVVPGSLRDGSVMLKAGIAVPVTNTEGNISEIEISARAMVERISAYLCKHATAFANAHCGSVAAEAGIRTGRRAKGKYILTEEDVTGCRKFPDAAAIGSWPIEEWGQDKRVRMTWLPENDYYTIPQDCLMSYSIDNLYFAGRTISATEKAIASARVIGICLQTGFSAGQLAASGMLK